LSICMISFRLSSISRLRCAFCSSTSCICLSSCCRAAVKKVAGRRPIVDR
jgi:hypothetical protein